MSAWMVSKKHIDTLVQLALYGPAELPANQTWYVPRLAGGRSVTADALGELLTKENLASIHSRYPDTLTNPDNTPGPHEHYWLVPYVFPDALHIGKHLTAVAGIKAIVCYEYQSCEHSEWEESEARKFCSALKDSLINYLPGYGAAPWGID